MTTADSLNIHLGTVHKEQLKKVPNAKEGRESIDLPIYGMQGVPEEFLVSGAKRIRMSNDTEENNTNTSSSNNPNNTTNTSSSAALINPMIPPSFMGIPPGIYPPFPPVPPNLPYGSLPNPTFPSSFQGRPPFPSTTSSNIYNYPPSYGGGGNTIPSGMYPNSYPGSMMMPPRPGMPYMYNNNNNVTNPNQTTNSNTNMNFSISMSLNAGRPPFNATGPLLPTVTSASTTMNTSITETSNFSGQPGSSSSVPSIATIGTTTNINPSFSTMASEVSSLLAAATATNGSILSSNTGNTPSVPSTTASTVPPTGILAKLVWNEEYLSPEEARASLNRYKFDRNAFEQDIENRLASILAARTGQIGH